MNAKFNSAYPGDNACIQGLVPVVLGVTGHRDVRAEDVSVLETATRAVFREIEALTVHSPHILISCLAEGADRIAAHCAIEMGWTLGVVLPASTDIYAQDFATGQSKSDFYTLLNKAAWVENANDQFAIKSDYLRAGIRMMQQSQLLIAYWDGITNGLEGGTSDVVKRFLSEIPISGFGLPGNSTPDARPVIHIMTRREHNEVKQELPGEVVWIPPAPGGMNGKGELDRWREVLRRIDLFNADARQFYTQHLSLLQASNLAAGEFDHKSAAMDASCNMFALADAMSTLAQQKRTQVFYHVSGLAMAAITLKQIYSNLLTSSFILGFAVICGIIALFVFRHATRQRIEERYLDYRSLAEACRVQYFWMKCGIRTSVENNFLLEQRDELEWVRRAISTNELSENIGLLKKPAGMACFEKVKSAWIEEQRHYFVGTIGKAGGNKAEYNKVKSTLWSRRARNLFMAGVFIVVVLVFFRTYLIDRWPENGSNLVHSMGVAYGLLFALAGMSKVYQKINAFSEHSRSFRRGGLLMLRAGQRLEAALSKTDLDFAQRIIYETGCEALDENGDWLLLHRDRPVEVPLS